PSTALAYSEYIIAGGENIGIQLNSTGIIIVGTYQIDGKNPAIDAKLQNGDKILSINGTEVNNINEMVSIIENSSSLDISVSYQRGSKIFDTVLKLIKDENNIYKTGLYVKDSINGVGTLTYIDPNTKIYGCLGHEIVEKNTGQKIEIKDGKIYNSTVTSITRSDNGSPGEKNASYDTSVIYGNVSKNTSSGVFGNYTSKIPNKKLYKVANPEEINMGTAKMLTVLEGVTVKEYDIEILKINKIDDNNKNILFTITDKELLEKTGGIVQGMSGSPIIQGDKIVGAVTHVVVDNPTKGYAIFITKMLEEAEN
ncbi:MAG: SpoIVB peptidase, partial [bacterium]|nr:SpoIVB peptidase [bacterium]